MMKLKEDREDSDGEEMDRDSGDSEKSTSSCDISDTDTDDSSEMDETECNRRRTECMENLTDLERQFSLLKEQLYRERITQIETKLSEVKLGRAQEYMVPLDELQENCRIRIEVAGLLRKYRLGNIRNKFDAEEQATNQNYSSEKFLAMDLIKDEIEDKIRKLEEDRKNVDINADLWALERSQNKLQPWHRGNRLTEDNNNLIRRKATVVSGPYIVYMLHDADIVEDWATIKKAATVCKRKSDWADSMASKKGFFKPKYQRDIKYHKDRKYLKERKPSFSLKPGQKLKLW